MVDNSSADFWRALASVITAAAKPRLFCEVALEITEQCVVVIPRVAGPELETHPQIIQPETLPRWHHADFRLSWKIKSRSRTPARRLEAEPNALIQRLARETPLRGAGRIHGELLQLGVSD